MKNERPNLGYSNVYWTKLDRKRIYAKVLVEEEILEDAEIVSLVKELQPNIDREQIKALADNFCPDDLTTQQQPVILYTSPTSTGEPNE
jgi:hypothetical protein